MYVREELVYQKNTGRLVGFVNIGDINTHLLDFERSLKEDASSEPQLATTMVVFMVRGLFTQLRFPYAQFPSCNLKGEFLFDPFWEAVYRLERLHFKVGMGC